MRTAEQVFIERVREAKEKQGMTDRELGRRLFVDRSTVTKLLHGDIRITIDRASAICEALGRSFPDLLSGSFDGREGN